MITATRKMMKYFKLQYENRKHELILMSIYDTDSDSKLSVDVSVEQ